MTMRIAQVLRLTAMTVALAAAGGVGLLATQAWADKPAKEAKESKLDGTWQVTAVTKNGVDDSKEEAAAGKLTLKDGTLVLVHGGQMMKGTYKADPTQSPATLDVEIGEGTDKGEALVGIYELDGDKLRLCIAHKDRNRPTAFESPGGSGLVLITLKRVKE